MDDIWTQPRIQQYIIDQIEESLTLEYKGAGSLERTDKAKTEITKDVSAMANSDGGLLIYGVREYKEQDKKHLPEKIDPIDSSKYSREWLEQIIGNIQPRISDLRIVPVRLDSANTDVVYVVDIPKSAVPHQATDKRYYKRYNFQSVAMDDYEINDIRNRQQYPKFKVNLQFRITRNWLGGNRLADISINFKKEPPRTIDTLSLEIELVNYGAVYAQYVSCRLMYPLLLHSALFLGRKNSFDLTEINGLKYCISSNTNTKRDIVGYENSPNGDQEPIYGPSWFNPILPNLTQRFTIGLKVDEIFEQKRYSGQYIYWEIYADNAPMQQGKVLIDDIPSILDDKTLRK